MPKGWIGVAYGDRFFRVIYRFQRTALAAVRPAAAEAEYPAVAAAAADVVDSEGPSADVWAHLGARGEQERPERPAVAAAGAAESETRRCRPR